MEAMFFKIYHYSMITTNRYDVIQNGRKSITLPRDILSFNYGTKYETVITQITEFMGQTWGPLGSCLPRWAPCWHHEPCYQGRNNPLMSIYSPRPGSAYISSRYNHVCTVIYLIYLETLNSAFAKITIGYSVTWFISIFIWFSVQSDYVCSICPCKL